MSKQRGYRTPSKRGAKSFNHHDSTYLTARAEDERRTRIIEQFMDNIYEENGYQIQRITATNLQKRGVDIVHTEEDGTRRKVDEKYAIKYYNKPLFTYSFELYSRNNPDNMGWLISPDSLTQDYALLWFKANDNFTEIIEYDLCIIDKQDLLKLIYDAGYHDKMVGEFLKYWDYRRHIHPDKDYSEKGEGREYRRYYKLDFGISLCQSVGLYEQPINIIVPKTELVKIAKHRFRGKYPN